MKKNTRYAIGFLIINCLFTLVYFYKLIIRLNSSMLAGGGDGGKNYFNYLYFIENDRGAHLTGQNYPYGEHIVFTDNMPAVAWTVATLRTWFPSIANYGLGIMHALLILSFFISAWLFYKILRFQKVQYGLAILGALFMSYCSPQYVRIFGHFGLGMIPIFPIVIYSLMKYNLRPCWKYPAIIGGTTLLFTFFHVYFLGFIIILIFSYTLAVFILKRHWRLKKRVGHVWPLWGAVVGAAAVFRLYLAVTDTVTDRPAKPFGFHDTVSKMEDYLTTDLNFLGRTLQFIFWKVPDQREGFAYIGFVGVLVFLYLTYRVLKSLYLRYIRHRLVPTHPVRKYRFWLVTTLFVFLYSLGIPFVWHFDFIEDYLSSFQQFRTMGRFSWMVFYLFSIYGVLVVSYLFNYLKRKKKYTLSKVLAVLLLGVFLIEWNGYRQNVYARLAPLYYNYDVFYNGDAPRWEKSLKNHGYALRDFQAVIGFPYFHVGSEKLALQNDIGATFGMVINFSIRSRLPIIDVMMSRTSWSQTFKSVNLVDGPFSYKKYIDDLPDQKKVVLMVNKNYPLNNGEQFIVAHAQFIDSADNIAVYVFDLPRLNEMDKQYTDTIMQRVDKDPRSEGVVNDTGHGFTYVNHLDTFRNQYNLYFIGKGAMEAPDKYYVPVDSFTIEHPTLDSTFLISTWLAYKNNIPQMPHIYYELYDARGNCLVQSDYLGITATLVLDKWVLAERLINMPPDAVKMKLWEVGGKKAFYALDEILLHPAHTVYFYKKDGKLYLNNRLQ